jgi:hypothetical protein
MDSDVALDPARTEAKATKPRHRTPLVTASAYLAVGFITVVATFGAHNQHGGAIVVAAGFAEAIIIVVDSIVESWEHDTKPSGLEIGAVFFAWGGLVLAVAPRDSFALASMLAWLAMVLGVTFAFMAPLTRWLVSAVDRPLLTSYETIAGGGQRKR